MLDTVLFRRIRTAARRFAGANEGNIAILFGIAVMPIISFVGAAVDYTRANSARSSMQAALDSTALMLAKDLTEGTINTSQITTKARPVFQGPLHQHLKPSRSQINATYTQNSGNGSTILVNGSGTIDTGFMRVVGFPTMDFKTSSTSAWGNVRMRVAMVLDVTGSMANERQDAGDADRRQGPGRSAQPRSPRMPATSTSPWFRSPRTSTSAPATTMQTWIDWSDWDAVRDEHVWAPAARRLHGQDYLSSQRQDLDTGPDQMDRLRHRPRPELRHHEHARRLRATRRRWSSPKSIPRGSTNYCKIEQLILRAADRAADLQLVFAQDGDRQLDPTGNTNQGIGLAWGWLTLGAGGAVQRAGQGYGELYLQGGHRPAVGRSEHAEPLVQQTASQIDARQKILCAQRQGAPYDITVYTVQVNTGGDADLCRAARTAPAARTSSS